MRKIVGKIKPFVVIYILVVLFAVGLLFLVSKIPQSMLVGNWEEDRNVDISLNNFHLLEEGNYATLVDDYTDNVKMDIAFRLNEQSIFTPSAYIVAADYTYDYGRYWHGYCILLRPLLLFLNLDQIRILYGALLAIAFLALIAALIRRKRFLAVIAVAAAFYICNFYVTTKSLQYFNCTFIAFIASALILYNPSIYKKRKCFYFFVIGMLVNYFDFLTFETLTLSLPLLFAELSSDDVFAKRISNTVKCFFSWLIGYAAMFLTKCLLYISVDQSAAIEMLKYKIVQRTLGNNETEKYSFSETLRLNLPCLKGISNSNYEALCFVLLILFVVALVIRKFYKRKELDTGIVIFLIGLIPIIRFFVIREHSADHFCFTYYALFTTTVSVSYIAISLTVNAANCLWRKL